MVTGQTGDGRDLDHGTHRPCFSAAGLVSIEVMKRLVMILAAGVVPVSVLVPASSAAPAAPEAATCAPVGARIESVVAVDRPGGTVTFPSNPPFPTTPPVEGVPAYCEITVTLTHGSDHVKVTNLLPKEGWNQRFQALGGSAYAAGDVI